MYAFTLGSSHVAGAPMIERLAHADGGNRTAQVLLAAWTIHCQRQALPQVVVS